MIRCRAFSTRPSAPRLVGVLTLPIGSDGAGAPRTWLELRDNAAVAVQLGGGLAPGEVRRLQVHQITRSDGTLPWRLEVGGSGNAPARHALLAEWAGRVLADWLAERARLALSGTWVFCTEQGAQWAKNTCDKASDGVLRRAGVQGGRGPLSPAPHLRTDRAARSQAAVRRGRQRARRQGHPGVALTLRARDRRLSHGGLICGATKKRLAPQPTPRLG